jgi:hypothetical protein
MLRLFEALAEVVPASEIGPWLDTRDPLICALFILLKDASLARKRSQRAQIHTFAEPPVKNCS